MGRVDGVDACAVENHTTRAGGEYNGVKIQLRDLEHTGGETAVSAIQRGLRCTFDTLPDKE